MTAGELLLRDGLASIAGATVGVLIGLVPGLHVNLAVFGVMSIAAVALNAFTPEELAVFVVAMAVAHGMAAFIPAVFLGAPSGENALVVFPGHELLRAGRGPSAVAAGQTGALLATVIGGFVSLLFFAAAPWAIPAAHRGIRDWLWVILVAVLVWFVVRELRRAAKSGLHSAALMRHGLLVMGTFALVGGLSEVVLSGACVATEGGMFAAFTGLFGMPMLVSRCCAWVTGARRSDGIERPEQQPAEVGPWRRLVGPAVLGSCGGLVVGLVPAIGPGEVGALLARGSTRPARQTADLEAARRYLVTLGAVGGADALLAIAALFLIGKSRSGASIGVEHLLGHEIDSLSPAGARGLLGRILFFGILAAVIARAAGLRIANSWGRIHARIDADHLVVAVVAGLGLFVTLSVGVYGLLLLAAATLIGLLAHRLRMRPASLMAFLIIPSAAFYLGVPALMLDPVSVHPIPSAACVAKAFGVALCVALGCYWSLSRKTRQATSACTSKPPGGVTRC